MHPLIEQFCRIAGVTSCQPHFFNRCQREFRDEIQPLLDERDRLIVELANLKAERLALETQLTAAGKKATRREAEVSA